MPTFFESSDVVSAPQIKFAYFFKAIESLEICDSACNEQSLIPVYCDWDIAEPQRATPPLIWTSILSKKSDITPEIIQHRFEELVFLYRKPEILGTYDGPAFTPGTQIKKQSKSTTETSFSLLEHKYCQLRTYVNFGNARGAQ